MTETPFQESGSPPAVVSADDLARAIVTDELALYYQPIVSLTDETLSGFEALVRWPHPEFGLVCASTLVTVAESCGLIRALDDWVLRTATRRLAAWQEDVLVTPGFRLAVNVSGSEMDGVRLVERVAGAIDESGVDARGLVIEVTESCQIVDIEAARRSADGLHVLGVEIALDDFGSQHSTFSRLNSLPFDVLKIDRAFVVGSESEVGRSFIRALVELGNVLGARIVAEGIETAEQAARMRELCAHEGQGFLWAPAVPPGAAEALLATGTLPSRDSSSWCPKPLCAV
ncbi:MAG TPA: EAL domain-containing protein [Acidimicrobiia bacterium]|jgi:EAL domain-containing protein (putative c-di-GMP-specific phosphodiesterase class I)